MGRIGKSYPRFAAAAEAPVLRASTTSAIPPLGAIIGIVGALALIAWLLTR